MGLQRQLLVNRSEVALHWKADLFAATLPDLDSRLQCHRSARGLAKPDLKPSQKFRDLLSFG